MPSFISPSLPPPTSSRPKVLVLGTPSYLDPAYLAEFQKSYDVTIINPPTRTALLTTLPPLQLTHGPFTALIARTGPQPYAPFDAALLAPLLPSLRILASGQAGYNDFDVPLLTRHRIWFCNTRHAICAATAELTVWLILSVLRDCAGKAARWDRGLVRGAGESVVGIVGMGAVGRRVARVCGALGMGVAYWTRGGRRVEDEEEGWRWCGTLEELCGSVDVVSVHVPLTEETRGLVGRRELGAMRRGGFVVNTARGGVVDEEALIEALETGRVARAGLDVFEGEEGGCSGIREYFLKSDRVVVQPHVGGLTTGSMGRAQKECFENVRAYFETGRPIAPVNEVGRKETGLKE